MAPSPPHPPALARWILGLLLPAGVRDAFAGDLEERFARDAGRDLRGARRAYWRDVLSPTVLRLRREVQGMPLPPGSPPGAGRGDGTMTSLMADLKFALRMIRRSPGFTAVAVLSLALGIGPNTAIFSVVNSALLQDWGVPEPEGVVDMYSLTSEGRHYYTYYRVYELIRDGAGDAFTGVAATALKGFNVEVDGEAELVLSEMVTGNYFDVLGVRAARGRTFLPEEDATPGTHPVVVVSDAYWREHLGADPGAVGGAIRVNGRPYTVVGIAPASFKGRTLPGVGTDLWVPVQTYPHLSPGQMSGTGDMFFIGRLRPGVSTAQARAVLDAVARSYNEERPDSRNKLAIGAANLAEIRFHPDMDGVIGGMALLLLGAVGLVLLVACVNLAGFLLARATDRRKEMAVRISMGAGRGAILRQLLVESALLAGLGGALGLALGVAASRLLAGIEAPVDIPIRLDVALDGSVLLFTAAVSVLAAGIFGLTPALEATRAPVAATLRDESGAAGGRSKGRARGVLVAAQMALSTVLIFGSALFLRSLQEATRLDVGFDTGAAAVVTVEPWASAMTPEEQSAFARELTRTVGTLPGVDRWGVTTRLPLDLGNTVTSFDIPGLEPPPDQDRHSIQLSAVSSGYLDAMGIPILEGRGFTDTDQEADADAQAAILSRAAAERWWPGESALGRVMYRGGDTDRPVTVVGVADDAKIWSLTEAPRPYLYLPLSESEFGRFNVVARGALPPGELAQRIRDEARRLRSDILVSEVGTMNDHLAYIYFLPRMAAVLISLVGALALLLACVGLYGMVSYAVARRTREVGIRMALGADGGTVVAMVVRGGLAVVAVGGLVGMAGSVGVGAALERFLIGVDGLDGAALLVAPAALVALAALAAWLPARRVSRVDPVRALRSE